MIAEAKKRVLDSLGCFYGAFDAKPVALLRNTFTKTETGDCSVWGTSRRSSPETAAWVNGSAVRALDFNDTYLSKEPCHPSDLISSFWAACEISGRRHQGRLLCEAIQMGYDVMVRLCDASSIRAKGWDHVTYLPIASAVGCAHILELNEEQTKNAVSLALVGQVAMRQTRIGTISDWKAACAAYAARSGLWAARLAKNGFTGPSDIFKGVHGFFKQVSGPFNLSKIKLNPRQIKNSSKILNTHIKFFPAEHHAQSAVEAAVRIRENVMFKSESIRKISVECFKVAVDIIGSEPEKWRPTTRETADHSLPYLVTAALLDGNVTLDQFKKKRYLDPDVRRLLKNFRVTDTAQYNRLYPKWMPSRVIVEFKGGTKVSEEVLRPRGYAGRPMSMEDVKNKFFKLARTHLSDNQMATLVKKIVNLEKIDKLSSLAPYLKIKK